MICEITLEQNQERHEQSQSSCSNVKLTFYSFGQHAFANWAFPCLSMRQKPFAPYANGKPRLSRFAFKYGLGHRRIPCIRQSFQQKNVWRNVRIEAVSSSNCIPTLWLKHGFRWFCFKMHKPGWNSVTAASLPFKLFFAPIVPLFKFPSLFSLLFLSLFSSCPFLFDYEYTRSILTRKILEFQENQKKIKTVSILYFFCKEEEDGYVIETWEREKRLCTSP